MIETTIVEKQKLKIKSPILIEGLPGIGLVGKIAAATSSPSSTPEKVAELYSPHFPHQVIMQKNGVMRMIKNQLLPRAKGKKHDLLILVGDVQAVTSEAQYQVKPIEVPTKFDGFTSTMMGDVDEITMAKPNPYPIEIAIKTQN